MMEKTEYADYKEETGDIPKNIFKSTFTCFCYEAARSYVFVALLAWLGGLLLALLTVDSSKHRWGAIGIPLTFGGSVILAPLILIVCRKMSMSRLVSKNVEGVAKAVEDTFSVEQEALALGWNEVASRLNREFYLEKKWRTPYCFFSGVECEARFIQHVLRPFFGEKLSNESERSAVRTAADVYQQRVVDQFNRAKKHTVRAEETLPRDSHWSKATWRISQSVRNKKVTQGLLVVCLLLTVLDPILGILTLIILLGVDSDEYPLKLLSPSETRTRDRIKLLATITQIEPKDDMNSWDDVAKSINAYWNETPSRSGTDRFFDGKDCFKYFEQRMRPAMRGKCGYPLAVAYEIFPLVSEVGGDSRV